MRGIIIGLYGFSGVMYAGGWISIATGHGINPMCVIFGLMSSGAGSALWAKHWLATRR